jgi:hypothetical protein
MRALKPEELDIVAGGDVSSSAPIYVTGTRQPPTILPPTEGGSGGTGGGFGGGGGGAGGYVTPGVSAAANAFASAHVHNNGTTAADQKEYQKAHDDVAELYNWAQQHPNDTVNIGNGESITGSELSADLANMTINISDTGGGPNGAETDYNFNTHLATITLNPQNSNLQIADDPNNQNGVGADWAVFHEIGHGTYDESFQPLSGTTAETQADTAANSFEDKLGIPHFSH